MRKETAWKGVTVVASECFWQQMTKRRMILDQDDTSDRKM
jgi:hypothetical protein